MSRRTWAQGTPRSTGQASAARLRKDAAPETSRCASPAGRRQGQLAEPAQFAAQELPVLRVERRGVEAALFVVRIEPLEYVLGRQVFLRRLRVTVGEQPVEPVELRRGLLRPGQFAGED